MAAFQIKPFSICIHWNLKRSCTIYLFCCKIFVSDVHCSVQTPICTALDSLAVKYHIAMVVVDTGQHQQLPSLLHLHSLRLHLHSRLLRLKLPSKEWSITNHLLCTPLRIGLISSEKYLYVCKPSWVQKTHLIKEFFRRLGRTTCSHFLYVWVGGNKFINSSISSCCAAHASFCNTNNCLLTT